MTLQEWMRGPAATRIRPTLAVRIAFGVFCLAAMGANSALADPAESVLYDFTGGADGGLSSATLAMDAAGVLYGTTTAGGSAGLGTVFELVPPVSGGASWTQKALHAFTGGADGAVASSAVIIGGKGKLYGVTYNGGASDAGTVFELDPPAGKKTVWQEKILFAFTGGTDGSHPISRLVLGRGGVLYGTTNAGGVPGNTGRASGNGVVFSLTPPAKRGAAWTQKVLYSFLGSTTADGDGAAPFGGLILDADGALYGTTEAGGGPGISATCTYGDGCGTAFKLNPPKSGMSNWTETVLWRFGAVAGDGAIAYSALTFGPGGVLYGVTSDGGSFPPYYGNLNLGTAYQLTPPAAGSTAWTEQVIHDFGFDYDYAYPLGDLSIDSSGALYGTALEGGSQTPVGETGGGGVFKLTPPAAGSTVWGETHVHNFTNDSGDFCLSGCYPEAGLVADGSGAFYGTTFEGGTFPAATDNVSPGVVFKITP